MKRFLPAPLLLSLLLLPLLPVSLLAAPPSVEGGKLSWGASPTFAPFEFQRDGKAVGFDVDMMAELGRRIGLSSAMTGMDFTGIIPAVQSGRIDAAVSGIYITPARQEVLDFVPYLRIGDQLVVPAGNPGKVAGKDALCGHKVVVATNTQYERTARALGEACTAAGKPAIDLLTVGTSAVVALTLAQGRAEVAVSSTAVIAAMQDNSPGTFAPLGEPFNTDTRLGIGVSKKNEALRDALVIALKAMHEDGTYARLLGTWGLPPSSSIF